MDVVIKVGGSMAADTAVLKALCTEIGRLAERFRLVVVPGGGEFADAVRTVDERFGLSSRVSHRMAVLGMDQYGLLLSELISKSRLAHSLGVIEGMSGSGHAVVLMSSRVVSRARSLEASWDVTSDSIAAYVAARLSAEKLVLVTDVDGVFSANTEVEARAELLEEVSASSLLQLGVRTSVDRFLPKLLLKYELECFVVNGRYPERLRRVLAGEPTVHTRIIPK